MQASVDATTGRPRAATAPFGAGVCMTHPALPQPMPTSQMGSDTISQPSSSMDVSGITITAAERSWRAQTHKTAAAIGSGYLQAQPPAAKHAGTVSHASMDASPRLGLRLAALAGGWAAEESGAHIPAAAPPLQSASGLRGGQKDVSAHGASTGPDMQAHVQRAGFSAGYIATGTTHQLARNDHETHGYVSGSAAQLHATSDFPRAESSRPIEHPLERYQHTGGGAEQRKATPNVPQHQPHRLSRDPRLQHQYAAGAEQQQAAFNPPQSQTHQHAWDASQQHRDAGGSAEQRRPNEAERLRDVSTDEVPGESNSQERDQEQRSDQFDGDPEVGGAHGMQNVWNAEHVEGLKERTCLGASNLG